MKKRIAIRAHGSKEAEDGFSGGLGLLQYFHEHVDVLDAEIVAVISPFESGSVATKTALFNEITNSSLPHVCVKTYADADYQQITELYSIDLHFFSGWLKFVRGMQPETCVNIHPGPIQEVVGSDGTHRSFGGKGMRGDHVHQKVREAYQAGAIQSTSITMHYMTDQFDDPRYVIGQCNIPLLKTDTCWQDVKNRLRSIEPIFQQYVCHQLANGKIRVENEKVVIDDGVGFEGTVFGELGETI